jgi:serine O-acetyltransferase
MFRFLRLQVQVIREHDPAARSVLEILLCYPGLHCLFWHRPAHWLWRHRCPLLARLISQANRFFTGIEIHPGAQVHPTCFIDHGMGIVVGETAVIGENVRMFHGVTLGGTGKDKGKRHPTIGSNVLIGARATILGPVTIGDGAKIGAGAVVLDSVPQKATVVGLRAEPITRGHRTPRCNVAELQGRVEELEQLLAKGQAQ